MGIKTYKPVTPSRRYMTTSTFEEVTKKVPEKSLTSGKPGNAGRGAVLFKISNYATIS